MERQGRRRSLPDRRLGAAPAGGASGAAAGGGGAVDGGGWGPAGSGGGGGGVASGNFGPLAAPAVSVDHFRGCATVFRGSKFAFDPALFDRCPAGAAARSAGGGCHGARSQPGWAVRERHRPGPGCACDPRSCRRGSPERAGRTPASSAEKWGAAAGKMCGDPGHRQPGPGQPGQPGPGPGPGLPRPQTAPAAPGVAGSESEADVEIFRVLRSRGVQTNVAANAAEVHSVRALASQPPGDPGGCDRPPGTLGALCVAVALIWALAVTDAKSALFPSVSAEAWGTLAVVFFFLVVATLQLPDGLLVRPHPAWWRFVKGASILYLLLLCFALFQTPEAAREWLRKADARLAQPFVEKEYAVDCRLVAWDARSRGLGAVFANVRDKTDIFVLAHFLGWMVKALIIRDAKLLWIMSLLFEWMEISCRYILPNFWECWWDHLLLDIFGCNALGIALGLRLYKALGCQDYCWRGGRKEGAAGPVPRARGHVECGKAAAAAAAQPAAKTAAAAAVAAGAAGGGPVPGAGSPKNPSPESPSLCGSLPSAGENDRVVGERISENEGGGKKGGRGKDGTAAAVTPAPAGPEGAAGGKTAAAAASGAAAGGRSPFRSLLRARSVLSRLLPLQWTRYRWPPLCATFEGFCGLLFFVAGVTVLDLNIFFLKSALWLRVESWPVQLRTFLFVNIAAAGVRDFYEYIIRPRDQRRLGLQGWLGTAIIVSESLLAFRYRSALGPTLPCPVWVKAGWVVIIVGVAVKGTHLFLQDRNAGVEKIDSPL